MKTRRLEEQQEKAETSSWKLEDYLRMRSWTKTRGNALCTQNTSAEIERARCNSKVDRYFLGRTKQNARKEKDKTSTDR